MKKLSLVTIATVITMVAGAQVQFGVKAGLNLSTLSLSPKPPGISASMKPNFHAGALVSFSLSDRFKLQPEVYYSAQGANLKGDSLSGNYKLGYVSVPLLIKFQHESGFFAEVGPQIGFNLRAKIKSDGQSQDFKEFVKSTDFSGVIGIGYLSPLNIGVNARYNLGFTDINNDGEEVKIKNSVIQIGIFYVFGGRNE